MNATPHTLREDWSVPMPTRLRGNAAQRAAIIERHEQALEAGRSTYADPLSGLTVFTARFLADRGNCCESGCRHCPYATGSTSER